ncbi:MAG TPA: Slp family lipoprotein [Pseudomonadota bacterium]|nr:Slp family lipoprotein [Pseudomonadota bacterium]HRA36495.1 Slp family lipoprotein [Pseudomonadota bacterium]
MLRQTFIVVAALALGACATAPKPLAGTFTSNTPAEVVGEGTPVRWGGRILDAQPGPDSTCIQVLAFALDGRARPYPTDQSAGRFIACRQGFYDPAVFARDRELTVVGTLSGSVVQRIGEYDYRLPRIEATALYLWPERLPVVRFDSYPWGPGWGPGWGPSWGRHGWYGPWWP